MLVKKKQLKQWSNKVEREHAQKLYTSYIVGTNNIYNRLIPEYATTFEEIKREQSRIEWELLSAEQDLWEY